MSPRRGGQDFTLCHAGDAEAGPGAVCQQQALLAGQAPTPFPGLARFQASSHSTGVVLPRPKAAPHPRAAGRAGQGRGYFQPGWT